MSESDVIKVTIDDSELDAALAKIQQIVTLSAEATGTGAGATGGGVTGLPGINRELRLILGQLPGMREAIQVYFRLSRAMRGFQKGDMALYLTVLATAILVFKQAITYLESVEREKQEYAEFIRRERRLSKREYEYIQTMSGGVTVGGGSGVANQHYWSEP